MDLPALALLGKADGIVLGPIQVKSLMGESPFQQEDRLSLHGSTRRLQVWYCAERAV